MFSVVICVGPGRAPPAAAQRPAQRRFSPGSSSVENAFRNVAMIFSVSNDGRNDHAIRHSPHWMSRTRTARLSQLRPSVTITCSPRGFRKALTPSSASFSLGARCHPERCRKIAAKERNSSQNRYASASLPDNPTSRASPRRVGYRAATEIHPAVAPRQSSPRSTLCRHASVKRITSSASPGAPRRDS